MSRVLRLSRSKRFIEFSDAAWQMFRIYSQQQPESHEAGGILLGRIVEDTGDYLIDEATPPNSRDRRSRFWFRRSRSGSQRLVDDAWAKSEGTRIYLGEWHTHPEDDPFPSYVDRADRIRLLIQARCEQERLIFVIVGRRFVRVWDGKRSRLLVRKLGELPLDG